MPKQPTLSLKPDFDQTAARFEAWWRGEIVDRLPVTFVTRCRPHERPVSHHATLRDRWLDAEFFVDCELDDMVHRDHPGDCIPRFSPNIGPELTGTLYGCEIEFGEHTSWSKPIVKTLDDWRRVLEMEPNFDNVYWQAIERMMRIAQERNDGRFVLALPDLHGNYDILASLCEPEKVCLDLMDEPELIARAAMHVAKGYNAAFERCWQIVREAGFGSTTWCPVYHDGPAYLPSCDFWCMVSGEQARELILPAILEECRPLERTLFHLDGPDALRHLDLLLECDAIDAVQWVYGAGGGRASDWLEVYERIRAAGRSIELRAQDLADAKAVVDRVGPEGVWVHFERPLPEDVPVQRVYDTLMG